MKYSITLPTMVLPTARTEVFINPNPPGHANARGVVGKNDRQVTHIWNHRVSAVAAALSEAVRMDVHIRHDSHVEVAALLPDDAEPSAVELYNAIDETSRVYVIVEEKLPYPTILPVGRAEKKSAAFALSAGPTPEFVDAHIPDFAAANQLWVLTPSGAQQRSQ
jgi:hypothetical protein